MLKFNLVPPLCHIIMTFSFFFFVTLLLEKSLLDNEHQILMNYKLQTTHRILQIMRPDAT